MSATAILDAPSVKAWPQVKLADVADIVNGGTPKSNVAEFWDGEHQWLTPADMGKMVGREIAQTPRTITAMGLAKSSARLAPPRSVILSTRAPIGHLAINSVPMAFNQGCRALVPGPKLDHFFLYYFLLHSRELLNELGTGTTFKELSATSLKTVQMPLPPLAEQKRIVSVLDQAFTALDYTRALAEANLADVQVLERSILRASVTPKGDGWHTCKLGNALSVLSGFAFKSKEYTETGHFLIRIANVQDGQISLHRPQFVQLSNKTKKFELSEGDILTSLTGNIGRVAVIEKEHLPAALNQRVAKLVPEGRSVSRDYLLEFLRSGWFGEPLREKGRGAAQQNVSPHEIKNIDFFYPDAIRQAEIVEAGRLTHKSCAQLQDRYQQTIADIADLRQSLIQKAFAGELT